MAFNSHHAPGLHCLYDFVGLVYFAPPSPEKNPSLPRTPSCCSYPIPLISVALLKTVIPQYSYILRCPVVIGQRVMVSNQEV